MRIGPFVLLGFGVLCSPLVHAAEIPMATGYQFTVIADVRMDDAAEQFDELGVYPSIGAAGDVAYTAIRHADPPLQGIYLGNSQKTIKVANTTDTFADQTPINLLGLAPVVNGKREVVYWAGRQSEENLLVVASGIFRGGEGTPAQRIADSTSPMKIQRPEAPAPCQTRFRAFGAYPSLNERGEIVFWAIYQDTDEKVHRAILLEDRSGLRSVIDSALPTEEPFVWIEGPCLADHGGLAFWGERTGQIRGVFRHTGLPFPDAIPSDTTRAILAGTAIDYFAGLSLNAGGSLCFRAFLALDPDDHWNRRKQALCVVRPGSETPSEIVRSGDAKDHFLFLGYPSLNDDGLIAFAATEHSYHTFHPEGPKTRRQGIYVIDGRQRPQAVTRTGDRPAALRSPIRYVSAAWHHALNAQGQITFWAELADGSQVILRASPCCQGNR